MKHHDHDIDSGTLYKDMLQKHIGYCFNSELSNHKHDKFLPINKNACTSTPKNCQKKLL